MTKTYQDVSFAFAEAGDLEAFNDLNGFTNLHLWGPTFGHASWCAANFPSRSSLAKTIAVGLAPSGRPHLSFSSCWHNFSNSLPMRDFPQTGPQPFKTFCLNLMNLTAFFVEILVFNHCCDEKHLPFSQNSPRLRVR